MTKKARFDQWLTDKYPNQPSYWLDCLNELDDNLKPIENDGPIMELKPDFQQALTDFKKSSEEILETWKELREKIKRKISSSESSQLQLNQIFASLVSRNIVTFTKNFTYEELIEEAKRTNNEISQLRQENYALKRRLDGDNDDEGPDIEEVD